MTGSADTACYFPVAEFKTAGEATGMSHVLDSPASGEPKTLERLFSIVTHPAVRLGFLDARAGRPFDLWNILDRISSETPEGALKRLGWHREIGPLDGDRAGRVALAEYRYEEGRQLYTEEGVRCRAWGHPDYPPRAVMDYIRTRSRALHNSDHPGDAVPDDA